jgi:hypothetical protein
MSGSNHLTFAWSLSMKTLYFLFMVLFWISFAQSQDFSTPARIDEIGINDIEFDKNRVDISLYMLSSRECVNDSKEYTPIIMDTIIVYSLPSTPCEDRLISGVELSIQNPKPTTYTFIVNNKRIALDLSPYYYAINPKDLRVSKILKYEVEVAAEVIYPSSCAMGIQNHVVTREDKTFFVTLIGRSSGDYSCLQVIGEETYTFSIPINDLPEGVYKIWIGDKSVTFELK